MERLEVDEELTVREGGAYAVRPVHGEGRLPDARRAGDQHDRSGRRVVEDVVEAGQLGRPAAETGDVVRHQRRSRTVGRCHRSGDPVNRLRVDAGLRRQILLRQAQSLPKFAHVRTEHFQAPVGRHRS
jgi:hypothetical protein